MKIRPPASPLSHPRRLGFGPNRRGLLLLMTLMMLSLFMMAGMLMLTIAIRARQAARANFAAIQQTELADKVPRESLDEALLALLRGTISGATPSVAVVGAGDPPLENLLEDKYGPSVSGAARIPTGVSTSDTVITVTGPSSSLSPAVTEPSRLNGRILTIKPDPNDGDILSFRILGTGTSSTAGEWMYYLSNPPSLAAKRFPPSEKTFDVVINGREFTPDASGGGPEPYDAFDNANVWLAQPMIVSGTVAQMKRVSFAGEVEYNNSSKRWEVMSGPFLGRPLEVDNDNDGVLDGIWITGTAAVGAPSVPPFVIADRPSPKGGMMKFEVSYLVLDLDGRLNINACGMASQPATYPTSPTVPLGMGYGTADLDCSHLFASSFPTLPSYGGIPAFPATWSNLVLSGSPSEVKSQDETLRRRPPLIGSIDGRYGDNGVPGRPGDDPSQNQWTVSGTGAVGPLSVVSGANAVDDLKGQTRVFVAAPSSDEIMPTLKFIRPTATVPPSATNDWEDDPYEIRLDSAAPRLGVARRTAPAGGSDDNPFTLEELERILRPNDPDVIELPQRLAAGMEAVAQRNRFYVTTDSWSSPAVTGDAAAAIENFIANELSTPLTYSGTSWESAPGTAPNPISPDLAAGLKFNLNRPILSGTSPAALKQQHEYCKGLYTLGVIATGSASSPTVDEIAQWAVNVLDFRDADSICTGFEYDRDIKNGWDVDGDLATDTDGGTERAVVFGAERPELVITEAAAWRDTTSGTAQLLVNLHRLPFHSEKVTASGTAKVETADARLVDNGNLLLSSTGSNPRAIWQLRFSNSDVVQFKNADKTSGPVHILSGTAITESTLTIHGTTASPTLLTSGTTHLCIASAASVTGAAISIPVCPVDKDGPFDFGVDATEGKVVLERLANPDVPNSATNPFVPFDEVEFTGIPDIGTGGTPLKKRRKGPQDNPGDRLAAFWRRDFVNQSATSVALDKYVSGNTYTSSSVTTGTAPVSWFHWPNRPLISQAELALVPTGIPSTSGMLATYSGTSNSLVNNETQHVIGTGTTSIGHIILDATYVPSRFAENGITISGTQPSEQAVGLDQLQRIQLPKWREPGRINVNTISFGAGDAEDDIVWHILMSGTTSRNLFTAKPPRGAIPAVPGDPKIGTVTQPAIPPTVPYGTSANPARSVAQILSGTTAAGKHINFKTITSGTSLSPRDKNPFFTADDAIRLANTVTATSNCFAVWVTIRITDTSPGAGSPITKRLFAVVDRSIPVGYSPNEDLNVSDCIRIKRYLD